MLEPSQNCIDLLVHYEGSRPAVYRDPVGLPTVGVGHLLTRAECEKWPVGHELSSEEVSQLLQQDLKESAEAVRDLVTHPLTQGQFDALVSFTFNLGRKNLARSGLLRKLNLGLVDEAATEFLRWTFAGGRKLRGLVLRRKAEQQLFVTGRFVPTKDDENG